VKKIFFILMIFACDSVYAQVVVNCMNITSDAKGTSCSQITVCDGRLRVNVSSGIGPFYYVWDNGEAGYGLNEMNGLCEGQHTVNVIDMGRIENAFNPLASPTFIPPLALLLKQSCYMESHSYTIALGTKDCAVTDYCNELISGEINCDCPLLLSIVTRPASCLTTNDGLISFNVGGGTPPYKFTWTDRPTSTAMNRSVYGGVNYEVIIIDAQGRKTGANFPVGVSTTNCEGGIFPGLEDSIEALLLAAIRQLNTFVVVPVDIDYNYPQFLCPYEVSIAAENPTTITSEDGRISLYLELDDGQNVPTTYDWGLDQNTGVGSEGNKDELPAKRYSILMEANGCNAKTDIEFNALCYAETAPETVDNNQYYHLTDIPKGVPVSVDNANVLHVAYYEEYKQMNQKLEYRLYDVNGTIIPNSVTYPITFGLNTLHFDCYEMNLEGLYLLEITTSKNEKQYLRFNTQE
jgi:hypothetical protein